MKTLFFETIDSTNTYLKKHYPEYEDMTFVAAGLQTAGRGRNERSWQASDGRNLTFSLLIKDKAVMSAYRAVSILAAYSVLEVIETYGLREVMIKWPNDVYVRDQKICGILLEAVTKQEMECLIIGIGINVNEDAFTGEYRQPPTSLKLQLDEEVDLEAFREKIYSRLCANIEELKKGTDFYPEISSHDYLKDKEVYGVLRGEERKMKVIGISEDYSLQVLCDGKKTDLSSSEVTFHREEGKL